MALADRMLSVFDVRRSEAPLVGRLLTLYLVLISAVVLIQATAFGLFIAEHGAATLPTTYLVIAATGPLVALAGLRLGARVRFGQLLVGTLVFLLVVTVVLWAGLLTPGARIATFLLPVWFQIFVTQVNLVVWPLAIRLFDVRQGKRVFGLIGAGNWIANSIGGLVVVPLVAWVGPVHLFGAAALVLVLGIVLLARILRRHAGDTPPAEAPAALSGGRPARTDIGRYVALIFGYNFLWWLAFFFVDTIFFVEAGARFADAEALTAFMGRFLSATGLVALITTVFLTGRIVRRFGVPAGLAAMPILVVLALGSVAVAGSIGVPALVVFLFAAAGKLVNVAIGFSLDMSATNLAYQALPPSQRIRVQTTSEGIVQPVAVGLAGVVLLVLTRYVGADSTFLAWVFAPIGLGMVALSLAVGRHYPRILAGELARRRWGADAADWSDAHAIALLRSHLGSARASEVLFALDRLAEAGALAAADLRTLLTHASAEVRAAVVARLESTPMAVAAPFLAERAREEPLPEIRASALRAWAATDAAAAEATLLAALDDPAAAVRSAALTALLRAGGAAAMRQAGAALDALARAGEAAERVRAARIVGNVGVQGREELVLRLLADDHAEVRRAALAGLGSTADQRLWSAALVAGAAPGASRSLERALVAGGDDALAIAARNLEGPHRTVPVVVATIRACGRLGSPQAVASLERWRSDRLALVRWHALRALAERRLPARDRGAVRREVATIAARLTFLARGAASAGGELGAPLLAAALEEAWRRERDVLLWSLSRIVDPPDPVLDARVALTRLAGSDAARPLEVIDASLPGELRSLVMPALERHVAPQRDIVEADDLLSACMEGGDARGFGAWVTACALHAAVGAAHPRARAWAEAARSARDPLVREMADWAIRRLAGTETEGEAMVLSRLERVLILRTVDIFAGTPDDVLADVAEVVAEESCGAGQRVFEKGALGDSMYVIADGSVRVHDGDVTLDTLHERQVVGEMALLDPAPRAASVTALEPSRLLRLPQASFHELLHERPEIAIAIMQVLARRLRSRLADLAGVPVVAEERA
jgi:ATP:ADP antiporter, AAA family